MKKLLLALCLAALGAACHTTGANMHDTSCTGKDCTDCTKEQMENCKDCQGMTDCQKTDGEQVCPVTGKRMN